MYIHHIDLAIWAWITFSLGLVIGWVLHWTATKTLAKRRLHADAERRRKLWEGRAARSSVRMGGADWMK